MQIRTAAIHMLNTSTKLAKESICIIGLGQALLVGLSITSVTLANSQAVKTAGGSMEWS
jgi:hypothetical protein